ncbi:hypothetical protein MAPG_02428 [Magnaporthiopsis poae ATCC 64411]|uniref:Uncharacterized protein n=1 Tax=Magnaporthiopsis poae (strain ATCC 64411 / 73-15) TaxID=644358 RepID=A0A0C4DRC0_MAGP6|nr:hypothetical protein MAPG_02428 [Magnaporthiopsis poae ATCC 64411]
MSNNGRARAGAPLTGTDIDSHGRTQRIKDTAASALEHGARHTQPARRYRLAFNASRPGCLDDIIWKRKRQSAYQQNRTGKEVLKKKKSQSYGWPMGSDQRPGGGERHSKG